MKKSTFIEEDHHSEGLEEIISKPPSWLLKRGISFILLTVLLIIGLSVFIRYPEIIPAIIRFNTIDSPKPIMSKINGSLTKLLVNDGENVTIGTPIAFLESTADHSQVLNMLDRIEDLRSNHNNKDFDLELLLTPNILNLGELQGSYQTLYFAYLNFKAASSEGLYQKRKNIIHSELHNLDQQFDRSKKSMEFQRQQLSLAEKEFERYKLLAEKKVISPAELQEKEASLLVKRQSIPQMESTLINYESSILSKNKELNEIDNQISEEKKKFIQALNIFISDAEKWKKQYVIVSSVEGKLVYGSFLQENQSVKEGQELFLINTKNADYYGELSLTQNAAAKVKRGQDVLIKVRSYPYEEFGYLHGKINYMSDIPLHDTTFYAKVELKRSSQDSLIKLKPGLLGDIEIITDDQSIFKRIWNNLTKNLKF
ncbi:HlyD family efflux transporter periplasmic adaptor subunit [Sphingobacterium sp.]|uniref:HlyD family secretion protein n=1 Tax=Sphingobacterium sp. TaxID=341027 RepID=UPI0031E1078D